MVLLFVVVLLTLLAVMGGAYLVSSRIDNAQVSNAARGGEVSPFGLAAADRVDQIMAKAQAAAQRKLFLDVFGYNGIVPTSAGTFPSAQRQLGDDSGDAGGVNNRKPPTDPTDPNGIIGDGVSDLIWRPSNANRVAVMPLPPLDQNGDGTPDYPTPNQLGVFAPMGAFGGYPVRWMIDYGATAPEPFAKTVQFPYYHVDALGGTDTHLASRMPVFDNYRTPALFDFIWPWISGPIVGVPDFPVDNIFFNPLADPSLNEWISFDARPTMAAGFDPDRQRADLIPSTLGPVGYPAPPEVSSLTTDPEFYNDRLRTWPALLGAFDFDQDPATAPSTAPFLGADADGDGVADAGLVPIVFNEAAPIGSIDRYRDPQSGYFYFVAVRIVDNNAAVNVNTALTRHGEVLLPPQTTPSDLRIRDYETDFTGAPEPGIAPNRGIYLSNIGLYELFAPGGGASGATRSTQFQALLPTMLGDPTAMNVDNASALPRIDMQQATLGELLAMNRDRILDYVSPFPTPFPNTANGLANVRPFRSVDEDATLLAKGAGWLIPETSPTRLESAAFDSLRVAAGNYVPNPKLQFEFFPIGSDVGLPGEKTTVPPFIDESFILRALWAAHFKHADPDMTTIGLFELGYIAPGTLGPRFGSRAWPLSPRAALVAHNGTSQSYRPQTLLPTIDLRTPGLVVRFDMNGDLVVEGMPPYAVDGSGLQPRPPVRASVNTAGFAELWRAFWNVMLEPDFSPAVAPYIGPVPSFVPGQRLTSGNPANTTERMFRNDLFQARSGSAGGASPSEYQILTLRAALAAINALDIRDIEDTRISSSGVDTLWGTADDAHPVPSAADIALPPGQGEVGPTFFARAIGGEAQPFITEVFMTFLPGGGSQYLGIELYNPYPFELNLSNWYLIATTRMGSGAIDVIGAAGGIKNLSSPIDADFTLAINVTIPPNSHVVLQNEVPPAPISIDPQAQADGRVYTGQPPAPGQPGGIFMPTGSSRLQAGATGDVNREVILMRPLEPNGGTALNVDDLLARWAPADVFDPTGIFPAGVAPPPGSDRNRWRYVRPNGVPDPGNPGLAVPDQRGWRFVSHGAYSQAPDPGYGHTSGMVPVPLATAGGLGRADLDAEVAASYGPIRSIPWGPVVAGPVAVDDSTGTSTQKPLYPYGGFARDGDALGIPYFGAYRVYRDGNGLMPPDTSFNPISITDPTGDELIELVPPTLDAFFADGDLAPVTTHVGRFIPQGREDTNGDGILDPGEDINGNGVLDNYIPAAAIADEGYTWAADLFEYITTLHTPSWDFLPQADARYFDNSPREDANSNGTLDAGEDLNGNGQLDGESNMLLANPGSVPVQGSSLTTLFQQPAEPLNNDGIALPNDYTEAFLPVEGQLNLNTVDFGLLKLLPLAVDATGTIDTGGPAAARISGLLTPASPTDGLAGSLFMGRNARAYDSLFRLNHLPENFTLGTGQFRDFGATAAPPVSRRAAGDITGMKYQNPLATYPAFADLGGGVADTWYYDSELLPAATPNYEDDTIQLTRISNLTTLRSDSYTVYIVVQAWENVDNDPTTPPARLVRQERTAFSVDRSGVMPFKLDGTPWTPADVNGDAWRDALKITPVPVK